MQEAFMTDRLRVYVNTDVRGVEIAGSVKNVLAIAAGISDGLGYGDNTKAAIVTRGVAEIKRLGMAMGARAQTFAGLAGIGDVVVTCMSRHSRNRHHTDSEGQ
jgi:glycerol-3-phosphate dehydrogenase (NAD(P)+)